MIERLDGGLILRRATAADAAELESLNAAVHGDPDEPDASIGVWTRDLLLRPHPTFGAGGYAVVEDGATGRIVSTLNLIPQTWSYGGVAFGVGRVELVGTLPAYRRRGLIRRQMEEAHRWSAALGHTVQMITGISHFYQQFGYEQGLAMYGARAGARHRIPRLATGAGEPYRLRPATAPDADFLARVEAAARPRYLLSVVRDAALWRYELEGMSAGHSKRRLIRIVEAGAGAARPEGEAVGYVVQREGRAPAVTVVAYELTSFVQVREVGNDAGRIVQRWSCGANGLSQTAGPLEVIPTDAGVTGTGRMSDVAGVTLPPPDRWQAGYTWKESFGAKFSGLDVVPGTQPRSEGAVERTHTIVGQEAVTVPAGTYNAWRVDTIATGQVTVTLGGQPETLDVTNSRTAWYVEGLGLVKSVDTLDDMVIDQMELLSAAP